MGDAEFASGESVHESKPACQCGTSAGGSDHLNFEANAGAAGGDKTCDRSNTYIVSLDVGTTTIRAHVYDQTTTIRGTGSCKVRTFLAVELVDLCFV